MCHTWSSPWVPGRCRRPRHSSWPHSPWSDRVYRPPGPWPCFPPHAARRTETSSAYSSGRPTSAAHWTGTETGVSPGRRCQLSPPWLFSWTGLSPTPTKRERGGCQEGDLNVIWWLSSVGLYDWLCVCTPWVCIDLIDLFHSCSQSTRVMQNAQLHSNNTSKHDIQEKSSHKKLQFKVSHFVIKKSDGRCQW